jgi:hypothetical protein
MSGLIRINLNDRGLGTNDYIRVGVGPSTQ